MIAEQIKQLMPPEFQERTYIGEFPTDVDSCIVLTEVGGPHGTYFSKDQLDEPYLKVAVRDAIYQRGYELINICKRALTSYADAKTLSIILQGDIMYFGRDDKRRNMWQITFKIYSDPTVNSVGTKN